MDDTTTADEPQNGPDFRATHGAEEWTVGEIEAQQNLAAIDTLTAA